MKIAVIGAGNIGGSIGRKWAAAGHAVSYGARKPDGAELQTLVTAIGHGARATSIAEAVTAAEAILFAIPGSAMTQLIPSIAQQLAGKVLIDATNAMGGGAMNSVALLSGASPTAHVYRAFNSLGWENFENPKFGEVAADLFYAGPDGAPRTTIEQLIRDVGLRPVRVGGIDKVSVVDSIASLWFALALGEKKGRHLAFKVLGI